MRLAIRLMMLARKHATSSDELKSEIADLYATICAIDLDDKEDSIKKETRDFGTYEIIITSQYRKK